MRKRTFILLFFLTLFYLSSFSQYKEIDSLKNILKKTKGYNKKINIYLSLAEKLYKKSKYNESLEYSEEGRKLAEKNNDIKNVFLFTDLSGKNCLNLSEFDKSLQYFQNLYQIADAENNKKYKGFALTGLLINYRMTGMYEKSIQAGNQAIKLFEETRDKNNLNRVLSNTANIYLDIQDYKSAEKIFDKMLKSATADKDTLFIAGILEKKGVINFYKKFYPLSRKYYSEARKLYLQKNDKLSAAVQTGNIGETYEMEKKYKLAVKYYKQALIEEQKLHYTSGLIFLHQALGRSYTKLKQYKKAEKSCLKALSYIQETGEIRELPNTYKILQNIYAESGNYKRAYEYAQRTTEIKDSLTGENIQNQINKLKIKYESEKKEHENKLLRIKQKLQEKENKKQDLIITTISILLFFVLIFSFLIFRLYTKLKNSEKILAAKNEELNIAYSGIKHNIEYAGKIQYAMMASYNNILNFFPEYVIFYKPSHTLSGDFYWTKKINDTIFVAVADSTGHGVPGALLSITGMSFLNEIVNEDFIQTDVILNNLRNKIKYKLNQKEKSIENKDGWDISIFSFNIKTKETNFSGAFNSMYVIRKENNTKKIIKYKADRQPVRMYFKEHAFGKQNFRLKTNDLVWMFTDGFTDQYNTSEKKRFSKKRLETLLLKISEESLPTQKNILKEVFLKWKGNYEQIDDILIMGIRI